MTPLSKAFDISATHRPPPKLGTGLRGTVLGTVIRWKRLVVESRVQEDRWADVLRTFTSTAVQTELR